MKVDIKEHYIGYREADTTLNIIFGSTRKMLSHSPLLSALRGNCWKFNRAATRHVCRNVESKSAAVQTFQNVRSLHRYSLPVARSIASINVNVRQFSLSSSQESIRIAGVPDDVAIMIHRHASRPQTGASLQTLMKTGRGEYLHKTYEDHTHDPDDNSKVATDKILMQVAGFLRHELPIRLAHRILDLEGVPHMKEMGSVKQVRDLYITSFLELLSVEKQIKNMQQEEAFARILESIYERHASVLVQMARGAFELRAAIRNGTITTQGSISNSMGQNAVEFDAMEDTHAFLDRFYISRIG